jgi:hypothetical protein
MPPGLDPLQRTAGPRPTGRTTALILFSVTLVLLVAALPLALVQHQLGGGLSLFPVIVPFAVVGVIIATRQPANPIGWIMAAIAAIYTLGSDAGAYAVIAFGMGHPDLPLDRLAVAVTQCWIVLPMLLPLPVLLFPDGRRPTSRPWRATIWVYAAVCGMLLIGTAAKDAGAFTDRNIQIDDSGELLIFSQSPQGILDAIGLASFLVLVVIALSWVVRQVVAFRASTGERRQQLKWLVSGGAVAIIGFTFALAFSSASNPSPVLRLLSGAGFLGVIAVPVSIGIGVLKYGLYEIDRIISRTASYAIVTGLLLGTYVTIVALASNVVPKSSALVVATATLTSAAMARPLLRRVQDIVDRRFNRSRYDAAQTLEVFASLLRNQIDIDDVRDDLERIVNAKLEPRTVTVWTREPT